MIECNICDFITESKDEMFLHFEKRHREELNLARRMSEEKGLLQK